MADKLRKSKSGSGAPTAIVPNFKGQVYIDESTGNLYEAYGTSAGNWYLSLNVSALPASNPEQYFYAGDKTFRKVPSIPWSSISSSVAAVVNTAYLITGGTTVVTLPATCAVGDKIIVSNQGNNNPTMAKVVPASGDTINSVNYSYGSVDSTGYIGLLRYASIELTCIVENSTWIMSGGAGTYSLKINSSAIVETSDITRGVSYYIIKSIQLDTDTTLDSSNTSTAGITVAKANKSSLLTLTLSAEDAYHGQIIKIIGVGAGGWKIAQASSGSQIYFGSQSTTAGTGGYIASTKQYDAVELYCIDCDGVRSLWTVISSVGNITIV